MTSLYNEAARMLRNGSSEDAARRTDSLQHSRNAIELVLKDISEQGCPSLDRIAAHDGPSND